ECFRLPSQRQGCLAALSRRKGRPAGQLVQVCQPFTRARLDVVKVEVTRRAPGIVAEPASNRVDQRQSEDVDHVERLIREYPGLAATIGARSYSVRCLTSGHAALPGGASPSRRVPYRAP